MAKQGWCKVCVAKVVEAKTWPLLNGIAVPKPTKS